MNLLSPPNLSHTLQPIKSPTSSKAPTSPTNLHIYIRINTQSSPSRSITHGVPQGSVLGPLLFNIYLLPIFDIFTDYPDISFHTYADDLQLCPNCTDSHIYAPDRLSYCIKSIYQWLTSNSLKLNHTKTKASFIHLPQRSSTLPEPPSSLDNTSLPYSQHVRNLSFHIDTTLSLDSHIIHMHKSNHYHLHCLSLIRCSIPLPIAITLASSTPPLFDYCNSLLFNLPEYKLFKLQRLQNAVVRCNHLLPKLSLTIHKAIHHNSPDYLASLLHLHTPITTLQTRSSNTFILTTPHLHKLHSSNIRSFALSALYHWNSLPNHLRTNTSTPSFKRHLKTYYFSLAFPSTQ